MSRRAKSRPERFAEDRIVFAVMRLSPRIAGLLVLGAICAGAAIQEPRAAIEPGDEVVLADPTTTLRIGSAPVTNGWVHRVYTVGRIQDGWVWLEAPDASGWTRLHDVVPYEIALREARRRIEEGDDSHIAYFKRGQLWADRGRSDLAIEDFTEAIRRNPAYAPVYLNRGLVYRQRGELDKALEDLDRATGLYPIDPLTWFNRGLIRLDRGEVAEALKDFDRALRHAPYHTNSLFNRAVCKLALGRDGAAEDAEAYLFLAGWYEPRSPYAAILAALDHLASGNSNRAEGLINTALRREDEGQWPAPILEYLQGERELRALLFEEVTPSQKVEAYTYAGWKLWMDGRPELARKLFEWVVERSDSPQVPVLLARSALERLGSEAAPVVDGASSGD